MSHPILGMPHRKILHALAMVRSATNDQLALLCYRPGLLKFVRDLTRALVSEGYLTYEYKQWRDKPLGPTHHIFALTEKSRRFLLAEDYPLPPIPAPKPHAISTQAHRLGITDTVILTTQYARAHTERVTIETLVVDQNLRHRPFLLTGAGEPKRFTPDIWQTLVIDGKLRPFLIEYDRGTEMEEDRQWAPKIRALLAIASGPAQERFGVRGFTVGFVVNPLESARAQRRRERLIAWTEAELVKAGKRRWGSLFLFQEGDPAMMDPTAFYTAPTWYCPFDSVRHALIEN